MSGHYICDRCGYDGEHADYCVYLRPANEQWRGHRTKEEMNELKADVKFKKAQQLEDQAEGIMAEVVKLRQEANRLLK